MVCATLLGKLVDNVKYLVEEWGFIKPDYSVVRYDIWNEERYQSFKNEIRDLFNWYRLNILKK